MYASPHVSSGEFAPVQPCVTVVVTCPNDRIGKVIGPGGSGLRHLWRTAGVKAHVPRETLDNGDRQIQLTGTPDQVQQAQHILLQMIAQQGPAVGASAGPVAGHAGLPGMMPPAHVQISAAPPGSARLLLETGRAGHLVGKAGSGLREIREESGAHFELARGDWLGGRLLTVRPPLAVMLRCLDLICRKLGVAVDGSPCPVHMRVLIPSDAVGSVVGRSGGGLRALRELGIALELPRAEAAPGWRLLSVSGPAPSVCAAAAAVVAKLAEMAAPMLAPHLQSPLGMFLPPPSRPPQQIPQLMDPQQAMRQGVVAQHDGHQLQPLLDHLSLSHGQPSRGMASGLPQPQFYNGEVGAPAGVVPGVPSGSAAEPPHWFSSGGAEMEGGAGASGCGPTRASAVSSRDSAVSHGERNSVSHPRVSTSWA